MSIQYITGPDGITTFEVFVDDRTDLDKMNELGLHANMNELEGLRALEPFEL